MIILKRFDSRSDRRAVLSDLLSGATDGDNQHFTVTYEYVPGSIEILYNGQTLTSPNDFEEVGPDGIKFIYLRPTDLERFRANYTTGDCVSDNIERTFLELIDTPAAYAGQAGKVVRVNNNEHGLEFTTINEETPDFLGLTDTPTTYSGVNDYYVKVNSAGNGLEFVLSPGDTQEGITNIPTGVTSTAVTFGHAFGNENYVLTVSLENKVDSGPSVYPILIKDKVITGFTVEFSGNIDSDNYYLNWRATLSGSCFPGAGGSGVTELSTDPTPELGNHLAVGDNLIMLDTSPNGQSIHGYEIGSSGEGSEMYVSNNPTGFACPLYMRSDGTWAATCAASGINHMPCAALALEEDDGDVKKILWKGNIRKGNWSWTPGKTIYVSAVEGVLTDVEPTEGSWYQPIGLAISSDTIRFDPAFNPGKPNS